MKSSSGNGLKGLRKAMEKVGYKCIAVQARCMENLAYTSWEPDFHIKFPKKTYTELLECMQRYILTFSRFTSYLLPILELFRTVISRVLMLACSSCMSSKMMRFRGYQGPGSIQS